MRIATLLAAGDAPWESRLVQEAHDTPDVTLVRRCVGVADAVATAASGEVRVALLSLDLPGLDTDAVLRISDAGVHPVGVAAGSPDEETRAAALGLRAVIETGGLAGLAAIVEGLDERQAQVTDQSHEQPDLADDQAGSAPRGQVVAVWGPTGAPGRSTVALGVASETASLGLRTLLIDADVYGGAVAQQLAVLDEVSGLLAACRAADTGRLSADVLHSHVRGVAPGLGVLTGLPRADRWSGVRQPSYGAVLEVARQLAEVVVLDLGFSLETAESLTFDTAAPRRNGVTLHSLEHADTVALVGSADPLGLTRLTRAVFDLREAVPTAAPQVVVNKVRPGLGWSEQEVADTVDRFTGRPPVQLLPLDQDAVDTAWTSGRSLSECAHGSALQTELSMLAKQLTVADYPRLRRRRRRRGRR